MNVKDLNVKVFMLKGEQGDNSAALEAAEDAEAAAGRADVAATLANEKASAANTAAGAANSAASAANSAASAANDAAEDAEAAAGRADVAATLADQKAAAANTAAGAANTAAGAANTAAGAANTAASAANSAAEDAEAAAEATDARTSPVPYRIPLTVTWDGTDFDATTSLTAAQLNDLHRMGKLLEAVIKYNNVYHVCREYRYQTRQVTSVPGDVNCNGSVTPSDASLIMRHIAGLEIIPSSMGIINADVNRNGIVDRNDAEMIMNGESLPSPWTDEILTSITMSSYVNQGTNYIMIQIVIDQNDNVTITGEYRTV